MKFADLELEGALAVPDTRVLPPRSKRIFCLLMGQGNRFEFSVEKRPLLNEAWKFNFEGIR